jgi:Spy/CpxP family protein refolding chaperone
MRRGFTVGAVVVLSVILIAGLAWAEKCHKAEATKEQKCTKLKICTKAEGAESAQGTEHCAKMEGCKSMGGCRKMMSAMPMRRMMMPGMMGGRGRVGGMGTKDCPGSGMLQRLGCPGLYAKQAEELDLTEEQVEDLNTLKWAFQKSAIERKAEIEVARVELRELMDQENIDFGKMKSKISQIADMEKELRLTHLATIEKSRQILTAEQLERAQTLKKSWGRGMGGCTKEIVKEIIIEETPE